MRVKRSPAATFHSSQCGARYREMCAAPTRSPPPRVAPSGSGPRAACGSLRPRRAGLLRRRARALEPPPSAAPCARARRRAQLLFELRLRRRHRVAVRGEVDEHAAAKERAEPQRVGRSVDEPDVVGPRVVRVPVHVNHRERRRHRALLPVEVLGRLLRIKLEQVVVVRLERLGRDQREHLADRALRGARPAVRVLRVELQRRRPGVAHVVQVEAGLHRVGDPQAEAGREGAHRAADAARGGGADAGRRGRRIRRRRSRRGCGAKNSPTACRAPCSATMSRACGGSSPAGSPAPRRRTTWGGSRRRSRKSAPSRARGAPNPPASRQPAECARWPRPANGPTRSNVHSGVSQCSMRASSRSPPRQSVMLTDAFG